MKHIHPPPTGLPSFSNSANSRPLGHHLFRSLPAGFCLEDPSKAIGDFVSVGKLQPILCTEKGCNPIACQFAG